MIVSYFDFLVYDRHNNIRRILLCVEDNKSWIFIWLKLIVLHLQKKIWICVCSCRQRVVGQFSICSLNMCFCAWRQEQNQESCFIWPALFKKPHLYCSVLQTGYSLFWIEIFGTNLTSKNKKSQHVRHMIKSLWEKYEHS